jgi:peroxiredoxin
MANNDKWVDERMSSLNPAGFQPDVNRALARLRSRTTPHSRRWAWVTATAAAIAMSVMALPVPRAHAERFCRECLMEIQESGSFQDIYVHFVHALHHHLLFLQGPPDFALEGSDGNIVRLSNYRGKVVLLNFWATWCGGCKTEIPWLVEFQRTYGDRGLVVVGVSLDDDGWQKVRPFMATAGISYPVAIGHPRLVRFFSSSDALPVSALITRSGRIAATHTGVPAKNVYQSEIEQLLR